MTGVRLLLLAIAFLALPAWGQFGAPGGAGIPLGTGGAGPEPKQEKRNPAERSVHGTVTDASGNPVAGALVELKNKRTQEIRSLITHDKGTYLFDGLTKADDYQLTANWKDHASKPHTLSTYDTRDNPMVNLQLSENR